MKSLLISIAILLVVVPAAYALKFTGTTSQDRNVVLRTDSDGVPVQLTIRWHRRCSDGGQLTLPTTFREPFREATDTVLRDGGPYRTTVTDNQDREYQVRVRVRVRGHRVDEDTWEGRFRSKARVSRNGELVATCPRRLIRWRATH